MRPHAMFEPQELLKPIDRLVSELFDFGPRLATADGGAQSEEYETRERVAFVTTLGSSGRQVLKDRMND